ESAPALSAQVIPFAVSPIALIAGGGEFAATSRRPFYGAESAPVPQAPPAQPAGTERTAVPETKFGGGDEPAPAPEAAGLLTEAVPYGLAAGEGALGVVPGARAGAVAGRPGSAAGHWLGLSAGLLGAGLAYEGARRRRALSAPALAGVGSLAGPGLPPEDLS